MPERFKGAVLKTVVVTSHRGFESHPLRHELLQAVLPFAEARKGLAKMVSWPLIEGINLQAAN